VSLVETLAAKADPEVRARVERIELPWNSHGVDPLGVSKPHLVLFYSLLAQFYRHYFKVRTHGIEQVPARGRVMLVGNHSGGIAFDGAMIATAMLLELDPPRMAHGMAEKFLNALPISSIWTSRVGHFTGLPEHAVRLLEGDRMLLVFPEGARGTAKLYKDRNSLVKFGQGFMRLALQTKTPIVPVATLGGGDALPTVTNLYSLGKLVGVPYLPVTPWLLPLPRPARFDLYFGAPMRFEGKGTEDDDVIEGHVEKVKSKLAELIEQGKAER
jgi:1-acyl-sn-glycerol-3-phosphate acyltransferase